MVQPMIVPAMSVAVDPAQLAPIVTTMRLESGFPLEAESLRDCPASAVVPAKLVDRIKAVDRCAALRERKSP